MTFKPIPCPTRPYGPLVILGLIVLVGVAVLFALARPVDGFSFLSGLVVLGTLLVIVYLAYRSYAAYTLAYWVDRDGVTIIWGATQQLVPMGAIQRIRRGVSAVPRHRARFWHWPCPDRRRMECQGLGVLNSYATRPPFEQLILVTATENYGLSPADPEGFLEALQARYALGVARPLHSELRRPPLWTWPLWRDRTALFLVGAGLLGLLLMFGVLCIRFPGLSSDLPLHFDINGLPDRIAPKAGLFALPVIGLITWGLNLIAGVWVYRRVQPGGAYLLWGGAVAVEGIAGLALFNLMRW